MNILYICNSRVPSRTANSIHAMKMCHAYASLGHQVTLIVPDWNIGIEKDIEDVHSFYGVEHNFEFKKIPLANVRQMDFLHRGVLMPLMAALKKPTIVHSRALTSAWGTTRFFQMPTIFEIHAPIENKRRQKLFDQLIRSRHLRALVVITNALAQHIKEFIPKNMKLIVAPDGVDSSWLKQSLSVQNARKQLGIETNGRRLAVYTGHLYSGRGIELILELARRTTDHHFLIIGGRENEIENFRKSEQLPSNMQFAGFKPPSQMPIYLQAADVLLMPYQQQINVSGGGDTSRFASPMKMFEYMASGRPILASELPVLREVLRDGVNALLLPYKEPEPWTLALRRLHENPDLAEQLATRARADAESFTWANRAKNLLQSFE